MNIRNFGKALLCKSLWRGTNGDSLWSTSIRKKYMGNKELKYWYRKGTLGSPHGSAIWLSFRQIESFFLQNLSWNIQNGRNVHIGFDHIMHTGENFIVPPNIIMALHRKGIFTWSQIIVEWQEGTPIWKDPQELGLRGDLQQQWNNIMMTMRTSSICRMEGNDSLTWRGKREREEIQVKGIYLVLVKGIPYPFLNVFPMYLWKIGAPYKMIHFSWLIFPNKNLTWENLQKRNWSSPGICLMCKVEGEKNCHMFLNCCFTLQLWKDLANIFGFSLVYHSSLQDALFWWSSQKSSIRSIPKLLFWSVWKLRNKLLFQDGKEDIKSMLEKIISLHNSIPTKLTIHKNKNSKNQRRVQFSFPRAFLDGVAQHGRCACGILISINEDQHFSIYWNGGKGTNNKAEAMALAGLLHLSSFLYI